MLFYIKCPSCSRLISRNLDKYAKDLVEIRTDPKLTEAEKNELSANLFQKYKYNMICCRARIMGLIPYHEIINT